MQFRNTLATAISIAAFSAGAAVAEEGLYYGVGLAYSDAESASQPGGSTTSNASFGQLGVTVGYRWDQGDWFYATELDGELSLGNNFVGNSNSVCAVYANGPYYCAHDATLRVRFAVGTSSGDDYEFFATAGAVKVFGESAVSPTSQASASNTGYTVGIGAQRAMERGTLRGELIYDNAEDNGPPSFYRPTYEAITLKFSYLF